MALLEPQPAASPASRRRRSDARVVALSRASERLLSAAGAWPANRRPRACAYERMRVWHESVRGSECRGAGVRCRRRRRAEPRLHRREPAAAGARSCEAFIAAGGQLDRGAARCACSIARGRGAHLRHGGGELDRAPDRRGRWRALGGARRRRDSAPDRASYGQTAIVATRRHRSARTQRTAWQRFMKQRHAGVPAARRRHELDRLVGG